MNRACEPHDLDDRVLRDRAVAAARGDAPFDLLIAGGTLFDAVTAELRPANIGIVGPLVASVHAPAARHDAVERLDATGGVVTPGLIDTHMHIESSMITPAHYAEAIVPRGVTTVVWDPHELANVHGLAGVDWAVEATHDLPLRVIVQAPSCVPAAPGFERSGAAFGGDELEALLSRPEIGGVAEVMNMRGVIDRTMPVTDIVQEGLAAGKPVSGHARGLSGPDLAAFAVAGISSDHELTSADDLMEKLRAGMTIEMRGSHDHLLPDFVQALNALGHLPPTLTLCTDDIFPDDLLHHGGLDDVVRRLIRYGMPPSWALRAATFNAALRLRRLDLGVVAPGRRADLAVFADLRDVRASHVVANGAVVGVEGRKAVPVPATATEALRDSVHAPSFTAEDFCVRSNARRVRVATIDRPRFTRWGEAETRVENGHVVPPPGATLIGVVHRHGRAAPVPRTGFLTGWGAWRGAFCTSVSHDSHNLTAFGADPADLAVAVNAVIAMQGGMAVVADGKVTAALPLPLSGLLSDAPLTTVGRDFAAIRSAMDDIVDWQPPYLVFKACFGATLACNAGPHQTDQGIADVARGTLLESPILDILA